MLRPTKILPPIATAIKSRKKSAWLSFLYIDASILTPIRYFIFPLHNISIL